MRSALYWVIRFEDGTYEAPVSPSTVIRRIAVRWWSLALAAQQARAYRASGHPCRIVRVVRKETSK